MPSAEILHNYHLLRTISDSRINTSIRKNLIINLPDEAVVALRDIFLNCILGHITNIPADIEEIIKTNKNLIFKIIDKNEVYSEEERRSFYAQQKTLDLFTTILPSILTCLPRKKAPEVGEKYTSEGGAGFPGEKKKPKYPSIPLTGEEKSYLDLFVFNDD
jgi:hypothetical protein